MLRIFISFYLFIVFALVGLSALLDNLMFNNEPEQEYLELLAHTIASIKEADELYTLASHSNINIETMANNEMSFPDAQNRQLNEQGFIIAYGENDQPFIYSRLKSEQLVRVHLITNPVSPEDFLWYRIVFFAALAFLVALWSWPIWRDIKKLEVGAKSVQSDGSIKTITLGASSSLNVIATALQSLSEQVRLLLNNQRELTSAVAHEFRTPLARLKFAMASLQDSAQKASMEEELCELETLIQEMLEFSQSTHHEPELSFAEIPIADLVASQISSIPKTKLHNINIENHCDNLILQADGHFAERAVYNLISNALKYAKNQIIINTFESNKSIRIRVEDDGPGIPLELREKIFDAFYRPDQSRARHQGGAGLGLATVKRIQHWHHGDCWVEESASGGARFVLSYPKTLPCAKTSLN